MHTQKERERKLRLKNSALKNVNMIFEEEKNNAAGSIDYSEQPKRYPNVLSAFLTRFLKTLFKCLF